MVAYSGPNGGPNVDISNTKLGNLGANEVQKRVEALAFILKIIA